MRSTIRIIALAAAACGLAVALAACSTGFKPGSFAVSQPGGVGPVRLHLALCTQATEPCEASEGNLQGQLSLAFAVPPGSRAPQTLTAVPGSGGSPIQYSLDPEVAARLAELEMEEEGLTWPPPGSEIVGYLSEVVKETAGENMEWTIDADFGLPDAADGGSYGGPFTVTVLTGLRLVDGEHLASRPYLCAEGEFPEFTAICQINAQAQTNVSDLKIAPPAAVHANAGETASIPFSFDFAGTASPLPSFALGATTSLPGAAVALPEAGYAPTGVDGATHRAPPASRAVTVAIPAGAAPGSYDVTITAKTPAGGVVSRTATLAVTPVPPAPAPPPAAATMKLGKVKLNKRRGTASVSVALSGPGALTVTGKKIVRARRHAAAAKTVKVTIKGRGKAKRALGRKGKAKVKAKFRFQPTAGAVITKAKSITLKKRRAHRRHRRAG